MILLIDNYDSFVYNLARYLKELRQETVVCRNDATNLREIEAWAPQAIVISPGPCGPRQAGVSLDAITHLAGVVPILGVCLGHQCIGEAFGGRVVRAPEPVHGRTSPVFHHGRGVFEGVPQPLTATRYHSLVVSPVGLPDCLEVTARSGDGLIMGLQHREMLVVGVQFHPESILTVNGHRLLANFLRMAGLPCPSEDLRRCELVPSFHQQPAPPRVPPEIGGIKEESFSAPLSW